VLIKVKLKALQNALKRPIFGLPAVKKNENEKRKTEFRKNHNLSQAISRII